MWECGPCLQPEIILCVKRLLRTPPAAYVVAGRRGKYLGLRENACGMKKC